MWNVILDFLNTREFLKNFLIILKLETMFGEKKKITHEHVAMKLEVLKTTFLEAFLSVIH